MIDIFAVLLSVGLVIAVHRFLINELILIIDNTKPRHLEGQNEMIQVSIRSQTFSIINFFCFDDFILLADD